MVHFVGAGPGAVDLITIRGQKYIEEADVIIYAGSLVNPELLSKARPDCQVYDSSRLSLEEVIDLMKDSERSGEKIVRLHTGDPSIYGAIREQMDELDKLGISYDYTPGVSSFCGAASALNLEYTLPGISQSVLLTRMPGRTPVPDKEPTMVFFLSAGNIDGLVKELTEAGRSMDTPCAIVYKATWPDEEKYVTTLENLALVAEQHNITKTALIIVGDVVAPKGYDKSKLYDATFTTGFREGSSTNE
ncbi:MULTISPECIES: precorrin-4 C(11)-methyltransferase [unclassified Butyrivibrio]|uniref:precorrin-4 C(11)-methyltransferase n=1 Tax=unclassified Butyrivibrio TaxID=2639466 RepID=UPI0003B7841C|nr:MULTISPECIES: precorrin-4 C(11)-methyltransferase [unclassified Butyrivibrio]